MIIKDNIPLLLKEKNTWCVWDKKIPYNPTTCKNAKTNDITTFSDFDTAYNTYVSKCYDGIGFGLFHNIGVIDIDHCIDEAGHINELAKKIIELMNSYTEISPSGKGVHIMFYTSNFKYDTDTYYINNHKIGLEIYLPKMTNKYITVTGNRINNNDLSYCDDELKNILDMYMHREEKQNCLQPINCDTSPVDYLSIGLLKDKKLISYWNGNRPKQSESENDAGFMAKLLYWTNGDIDKAIKAFLNSPYTSQKDEEHKNKVLRKDYLINTARTVMPNTTAVLDNLKFEAEKQKMKKSQNLISARDLQNMDLPPTQYLVDNILPVGTTIISAPPKSGKSWFVMQMGVAIACEKPFLNNPTHQTGVLYLALEDNENRLQERINKVLKFTEAPTNLYLNNEISNLDDGLIDELKSILNKHTDIKLIIIDTLEKIRGKAQFGETSYGKDYRELGTLKKFADENKISLFIVHHTRKMKDADNPFNMVSGTNGIMGVADTTFIINKGKYNSKNATLHITGRDVESVDLVLCFNNSTFNWEYIGQADEINEESKKDEYFNDNLSKVIRKILHDSNGEWQGKAKELISFSKTAGIELDINTQALGYRLRDTNFINALRKYDNIIYSPITYKGNNAKVHRFYYPRN